MKLTDQQVENWRYILVDMIGPYAIIMPRDKVEEIAESFQHRINIGVKKDEEEMSQLSFKEGDTVRVRGKGKAKVLQLGLRESKVKWNWVDKTS